MDEFTINDFSIDEKHRIDQLYGNSFEGATPDDFALIARWERMKAIADVKSSEQMRLMREETEARVEAARAQRDFALAQLAKTAGGE